jgi:DNA repair exonuclease SbcCD ATPase subunit
MEEEKIKQLLQEADKGAEVVRIGAKEIAASARRRARHIKVRRAWFRAAAAAVILTAAGVWVAQIQKNLEAERTAAFEKQVAELSVRTDAIVNLLNEVLENDRRQKELAEAEARLAAVGNPMEEIESEIDKAAFVLVYQADVMYKQLEQTETAVETYKQVIKYFGDNRWAEVARERLKEIEKDNVNGNGKEGDIS